MLRKVIGALLLLVLVANLAMAQDEDDGLSLRLNRDFGFGMGANIQGTFSYRVSGPDDLARVVFLLDGEVIGEDTEAPFRLQFRTESYALGVHTMSAVGYASDGRTLQSNSIQRQFVAGSESTKVALWLIIPLVVIAIGGRFLTSWIAGRNRSNKDQPAIVGPFGGTLCPKCGRPFAMHIWGLNIGLGKYDRCPHCGKWSVVRRVHPDALYSAAEAFKDNEPEAAESSLTEEERLRKQLDDSRFDE
jgi:DNA-directed RNA polymerase subunit RPC12/RpoP